MNLSQSLKTVVGKAAGFLPLKALIKITGQCMVLPFYHSVTDKDLPHIKNAYGPRSVQQFIEDLDFLCKYYKPVCINELHNCIAKGNKKERIFHLTFDDGLSEFYYEAAPILLKRGIPATIFLNTDFIDNKDMFYRYKVSLIVEKLKKEKNYNPLLLHALNLPLKADKAAIINKINNLDDINIDVVNEIIKIMNINIEAYLKEYQPYMNQSQIAELKNSGFCIGAHSANHPHLYNLTPEKKRLQVSQCFDDIENRFGILDRYFSFPFTCEGISTDFFNWLFNSISCKLTFGSSGFKYDISDFHLHRISMELKDQTACSILKKKYAFYLLNMPFYRNEVRRA